MNKDEAAELVLLGGLSMLLSLHCSKELRLDMLRMKAGENADDNAGLSKTHN